LAARGVRFDRAYVQYTVCNPSRSTGLRPDQTQVLDNRTLLRDKLPNVITWPQLLREHGWYAAAYGKIFHLGNQRDPAAAARWADMPKSWNEARAFQASPAGKIVEGRNLTGGSLAWCRWGMTAGADDDQPDGQTARETIALIERLGEKPWLIGAGFHRPHDPFVVLARMKVLLLIDLRTCGRRFDEFVPGGNAVPTGQVDQQIAQVKKLVIEGKTVIIPGSEDAEGKTPPNQPAKAKQKKKAKK